MTIQPDVIHGRVPWAPSAYRLECPCGEEIAGSADLDGERVLRCLGRLAWHHQTHFWRRNQDGSLTLLMTTYTTYKEES